MKLLVATSNVGKVREIRSLLGDLDIQLETLSAFDSLPEAIESGATFEENARIKALHYASLTGLPTVSEDSGLEIDALDGAPGVRSARFNGESYPEKFQAIRSMLSERGLTTSPARFVSALALVEGGNEGGNEGRADGGKLLFEARGTVEGIVIPEPRGIGGFGYDPIFFYPPFGKTLAEVTPEEKDSVSHRGAAFRQLAAFLRRTP